MYIDSVCNYLKALKALNLFDVINGINSIFIEVPRIVSNFLTFKLTFS